MKQNTNKIFLILGLVFLVGLVAFFITENDVTGNYLKLLNIIMLFILWYYYNSTSKKIALVESGIQVGTKVISITEITSVKIYEDFIRLGGNYRTDQQTWKKYIQIKFHTNNSEGDEITRRIDDLSGFEEQLEEWALRNNLKYTRVPRGQAY